MLLAKAKSSREETMNWKRTKLIPAAVMAFAMYGFFGVQASAQSYPNRPITVILPYSAGSGADFAARITMDRLAKELKTSIVIDNRPGSSGIPGTLAAAKAKPDGYTLLFNATQQVITPALFKSLPYDMTNDFEPIARLTYHPLPLAVSASVPVKSLKEFVAYAKEHPGKLNYGSTGIGTVLHLMGAYFVHIAGLDVTHVPYSKAAEAIIGLGRGDVHFMFYNSNPLTPEIDAGRVKLLATTGNERLPQFKDIPAIAELYPEYAIYSWHGLSAPANTPPDVIEVLHNAMTKVMKDPEIHERFRRAGTSANHLGGPELKRFIASEIDLYKKIAKIAKIEPR